jgi:hypothetical protein
MEGSFRGLIRDANPVFDQNDLGKASEPKSEPT